MDKKKLRQQSVERSKNWWYCENMIHHPEQVGLLKMDFPQVFILIRDYGEAYFADFEEFRSHIAEINFFDPSERNKADLDEIIVDAWNFLVLSEQYDEESYGTMMDDYNQD